MQVYYTHDNGGRPYKVEIDGDTVQAYLESYQESTGSTYTNKVLTKVCDEIFVGKSPLCHMTEYSGGHGEEFDGNSILIKPVGEDNYIFIGRMIVSFQSISPIHEFVSMVGNNDVTYPYVKDSENRYYLIIEDVTVEMSQIEEDPYTDYYTSQIFYDYVFHGKTIECFLSGGIPTILRYHPFPQETYDYFLNDDGQPSLRYTDGSEEDLTKEAYVEMMEI